MRRLFKAGLLASLTTCSALMAQVGPSVGGPDIPKVQRPKIELPKRPRSVGDVVGARPDLTQYLMDEYSILDARLPVNITGCRNFIDAHNRFVCGAFNVVGESWLTETELAGLDANNGPTVISGTPEYWDVAFSAGCAIQNIDVLFSNKTPLKDYKVTIDTSAPNRAKILFFLDLDSKWTFENGERVYRSMGEVRLTGRVLCPKGTPLN